MNRRENIFLSQGGVKAPGQGTKETPNLNRQKLVGNPRSAGYVNPPVTRKGTVLKTQTLEGGVGPINMSTDYKFRIWKSVSRERSTLNSQLAMHR